MEDLDELELEKVVLQAGDHAVGRSLTALRVRQETGALIVAVRRNGKVANSPDPQTTLEEGDSVYIAGSASSVRQACELLGPGLQQSLTPISEEASP